MVQYTTVLSLQQHSHERYCHTFDSVALLLFGRSTALCSDAFTLIEFVFVRFQQKQQLHPTRLLDATRVQQNALFSKVELGNKRERSTSRTLKSEPRGQLHPEKRCTRTLLQSQVSQSQVNKLLHVVCAYVSVSVSGSQNFKLTSYFMLCVHM